MKKRFEEFSVWQDSEGNYHGQNDEEGTRKEIKLKVKVPNHKQQSDADFMYAKKMNEYIKEGIMPQIKLDEVIRKNGIWDESKEKEERELITKIADVAKKLRTGNIKKSEMAKLAKESIEARGKYLQLVNERNNILNNSAESLAQNHRFNYMAAVCTVYSNSERSFFDNYDTFLTQDNLGNPVCYLAGEYLAKLLYSLDNDFRKDWPEYKFLEKYKFVNDKLEWLDKDGNIVDYEGKPVKKVEVEVAPEKEPVFLDD